MQGLRGVLEAVSGLLVVTEGALKPGPHLGVS